MKILHISDPHFGCASNVFRDDEIVDVLSATIMLEKPEYLAITGDITYQGNSDGYGLAEATFRNVLGATGLDQKRVLICPGNHDITSSQFNPFNIFANSLRGDTAFFFKSTNSSCVYNSDDLFCLSLNSSYSLDHKHGLIDTEDLWKCLNLNKELIVRAPFKIVILHHHVINQFLRDKSVVKNAYELLSALDQYGFHLILHGHQHTKMAIRIGSTPILNIAVSSMNFPDSGFANGINVYEFNGERIAVTRYTFSKDCKKEGKLFPVQLGSIEEYAI